MDSKEFGLVAAQQLFHIEDIHYGFWEKDEVATLNNFKEAQKKHTDFLFQYIDNFIENKDQSKILDIGCGVGTNVKKLLDKGFKVDGLVPYPWMAKYASNVNSKYKSQDRGRIYKCKIEDFPIKGIKQKYQLVFFSESFQYVNMNSTFNILEKILKKHGTIIIFDFFKKDNIGDISPLGGGHSINFFYNVIKNFNYKIEEDIDITDNLSPNLKIINEIMVERLIPFSDTFDKFMLTRHKSIYRIIKWLLRKKINKIKFKYTNRDENAFKKFKTYRLIVLKKDI
tara:strand:+ start:7 stop:855 length:849 start_codon:yes stop_codon:yes gene_type:complete